MHWVGWWCQDRVEVNKLSFPPTWHGKKKHPKVNIAVILSVILVGFAYQKCHVQTSILRMRMPAWHGIPRKAGLTKMAHPRWEWWFLGDNPLSQVFSHPTLSDPYNSLSSATYC